MSFSAAASGGTGRGCPDLGTLELAPLPADVRAHVDGCPSCRIVVEVFAAAPANELDESDCLRFDALLAARNDGTLNVAGKNLLERHLAGCPDCRAVADTLSPIRDADGDHATLPKVDPGAYALGLEVARGGMGRILAARDLRVGRPVAVKELLGRSPDLAARFEREARVTARLQHPGIVPIYEIGRWPDGTPFYSMRMVDGRTLKSAIDETSSLATRLALLPAVVSAAEAVAFAHSQRVIHRDLTPSNVLVGGFGETVVIDWGLAKDLADDTEPDEAIGPYRSDAGDSRSLTGAGMVIGTAPYMPPEQAHAQPVDERADVYALGAILYHVLAGHAPYRGKTTAELLRQVKTGPPPPIEEAAPGTPRDLVSIVGKAMSRAPEARYPSARELVLELDRFRTGRMVEAHEYSRVELVRRFVRRNRGVVTAISLAALLLAAFATIAVTRIVRSRAEARATVRHLLEEEGRVELLAGQPLRAIAYLHGAYSRGSDSPSLRFLLASALRDIASVERDLDCGDDVRFFEISPDNTMLAAACQNVARVWTLHDGKLVATLGPHPHGFIGVRYSHDGKTLATWGEDGNARLWDARTGALRTTLAHGAEITFVTFTPDDRRVSTAGYDGMAHVWSADGSSRRSIVVSTALLRHVYGLLSHDGKHLLTVTIEGQGKGWDIDTGELRGGFSHGSFIVGGELSNDGVHAVTCGTDRLAKLWSVTTGAHVRTLTGHTEVVWRCVFSADGRRVLTAGHDGTAKVWEVATGMLVASVDHGGIVWMGHFAPDGRRFTTVGVDGRVKVWDAATGGLLASHDTLGGKIAKFTRDGRLIASRGDGRLRVWRDASGPLVGSATGSIAAIADDGSRVAVEAPDGWVTLRDTRTDRPIAHEPIHAPIAFSRHAVVAAAGASIVVIDPVTGATRLRVAQPARPLGIVAASESDRFAAIHADGAHVFEGARRLAAIPATHALLSADGKRLLAWDTGPPMIWSIDDHRRLATLPVAHHPLGFALGGSRLALLDEASRDVSLWNADTGAKLRELPNTSYTPAFDPTGRWLTTIGADHVVTVWDVRDGRVARSFVGEALMQAQVDPAGALVAGIDAHGKAAMVMSAADGRLLARWELEHEPPIIGEDEFRAPRGTARWSHRGDRVVTQSASVAVWAAGSELIPAQVDRLVRGHVPWHVVGGRLAWIDGKVSGRVENPFGSIRGARVVAEIRKPSDLGAGPISWVSSRTHVRKLDAITDEDGRFTLDKLFPGHYTLRASFPHGDHAHETPPILVHVGVATEEVVIALDRWH